MESLIVVQNRKSTFGITAIYLLKSRCLCQRVVHYTTSKLCSAHSQGPQKNRLTENISTTFNSSSFVALGLQLYSANWANKDGAPRCATLWSSLRRVASFSSAFLCHVKEPLWPLCLRFVFVVFSDKDYFYIYIVKKIKCDKSQVWHITNQQCRLCPLLYHIAQLLKSGFIWTVQYVSSWLRFRGRLDDI